LSSTAEQIRQFWKKNKTMVCERTHTKMTRRACLVRQGLLPRSEERGPIRHVPIECRDCPQGKRIAQEEKQEKRNTLNLSSKHFKEINHDPETE